MEERSKKSFWKVGWIPVSASIIVIWVSLMPLPALPEIKFIPADKLGHFITFFILTLLYLWAFEKQETANKLKKNNFLFSFVITVAIGGLIELLQHYLPVNRQGDWFDFYFDIAGILFSILFFPMIKSKILTPLKLLSFFLLLANPIFGQNAYEDAKAAQDKLNSEYKNPEESPLDEKDIKNFKSLDFFAIDTAYRVVATLLKKGQSPFFAMPTTTDRKPEYRLWAVAVFTLNGKEFKLNIYQNKRLLSDPVYNDYLFLPFTDLTNDIETYGGGRYIDLRIPEGDDIIIDFNQAYNPYCAYSHRYSCPKVPPDNFLNTEVKAGVKKFH